MSQRPYTDILTPEARASLLKEYHVLCSARDEGYKRAKPIEEQLAKANLEAEAARLKAQALSSKVDEAWGPEHHERKRKIARMADLLRFVPA